MKKDLFPRLSALSAGLWIGLFPTWGWAAQGTANWRHTYDTVMMWVNFVILLGLLIKFLGPPAKKFLRTYQANLASEFDKLTAQKDRAANDLQAFTASLQARRQRWENRYQKILAQGERDRLALIEEAQVQAHRLMGNANRQIEARVRDAARQFQGEIVDSAIAQAMEELPGQMTPAIERRWLEHFLAGIASRPSSNRKKVL